jgi:hypothetical protein
VRGLSEDRTNSSRTVYTRVVVRREGGREGRSVGLRAISTVLYILGFVFSLWIVALF